MQCMFSFRNAPGFVFTFSKLEDMEFMFNQSTLSNMSKVFRYESDIIHVCV